ncbi:hypothetical protein [Microcoleus sp. D3_18a_C4]
MSEFVRLEILHHPQEQARCLFHKEWWKMSVLSHILHPSQEQARCLFHKE